MLFMVVAADTDEAAFEKWDRYERGADKAALEHLLGHAAHDVNTEATSMAAAVQRNPSPINFNMGTIVGSHATCARLLDEVATMPGVAGIMMCFDDFLDGMERFATGIQPLMECRRGRVSASVAALL